LSSGSTVGKRGRKPLNGPPTAPTSDPTFLHLVESRPAAPSTDNRCPTVKRPWATRGLVNKVETHRLREQASRAMFVQRANLLNATTLAAARARVRRSSELAAARGRVRRFAVRCRARRARLRATRVRRPAAGRLILAAATVEYTENSFGDVALRGPPRLLSTGSCSWRQKQHWTDTPGVTKTFWVGSGRGASTLNGLEEPPAAPPFRRHNLNSQKASTVRCNISPLDSVIRRVRGHVPASSSPLPARATSMRRPCCLRPAPRPCPPAHWAARSGLTLIEVVGVGSRDYRVSDRVAPARLARKCARPRGAARAT